jgi:hypothetical protein
MHGCWSLGEQPVVRLLGYRVLHDGNGGPTVGNEERVLVVAQIVRAIMNMFEGPGEAF